MTQSPVWRYSDLLKEIKQYKYMPNPSFNQEKFILYILKRKQFIIVDDFVMPNTNYDIDSLFKESRTRV
jgi:hypothetical protein